MLAPHHAAQHRGWDSARTRSSNLTGLQSVLVRESHAIVRVRRAHAAVGAAGAAGAAAAARHRPHRRRCSADAPTAAASANGNGSTTSGGSGWTLCIADTPDFWPLADLHGAVFFPQQKADGWKAAFTRIDRLLALQMNKSLENRKAGR